MRRSDFSRRHFLTTSSLIPFSGLIYSEEVNPRPQATSQLVGPSQKVTVTPTEASVLPNADTIIPVTIIIEITGGFSVFGNEISAGEASIDLELGDFSLEEYDTNSGFSVSGESPVTIINDETVVAPSQHAVTLFLKAGDNPRIELVDSNHDDVDHNTPVEYDTGGEVNWDFFADIADQRSNLYNKYGEAYEGAIDGKAWEEQFAEETINILSTIAVDIAKSKATAAVADLLDEDWIKVLGAGYGLRNGIEGTAMGKAITSTFDLKYDFFDHTHKQAIECAGRSDDVLEDLQQLAIAERQAWEEKNRDSIVDALEDQRELLFDTSTGSESLRLESRAQRYYPNNLGRACDGIPFQVGPSDTADEVRDFFEMLMQYALDERQNVRDTLRFIDPPNASVSTVQHHSEVDADLRQLATGDLDELSVEFEVTNGSSAGLTSEEGYLSISHSEILKATLDESASDDVIDVIEHDIGDDIIDSDGSEVPADYPLLDINGQYEPGETKTLVVDFELDGDPIDEDEDDDAFEDVWFKYRSALQPFLIAEDPDTKAGQNEFARAPADNEGIAGEEGITEDQQGFTAYEVSAGNIDYPPTATIDAPAQADADDSVTFDGSASTAGSDIDSFSWEFDTDGDGSIDETRSGESVDDVTLEPGIATARLTVEDDRGLTDETETSVEIEEAPPLLASFDRRPSAPEPGDAVEFTSTGDADSYEWEIDGQNYSGESVSVTFDDPDEYEVSLEVSRSGESDEITSTFTVEDIEERFESPRARIAVIGNPEADEEIQFDGTESYHPLDDHSIDDYKWTVNGESFQSEPVTPLFETDRSYSVELTVITEIDNTELADSATMEITVGDDSAPPGDDPDPPAVIYFGDQDDAGTLYAVDVETEEKKWDFTTFGTFGNFTSSPIVVDGTLFVGSVEQFGLSISGSVYALDAETGDDKWRFATASQVDSSPTVVNNTLFVGSNDNYVYAVDVETGDELWAFETGGSVFSSPTVVDDTLFVGSADNNVYALDAGTGDELWTFETDSRVNSSPTVADGSLFVGSHDNNVYAINPETGNKLWIFETDGAVNPSPTVVDDTLFIGSNDNHVYALDAETGTEQWHFKTGDSVISSPTVVDGTLFIGSNDNHVYALDAETGTKRWHFETGNRISWSSPTAVDGTVFVGSTDGNVYVLDAETGDEEWTYQTGAQHFRSSPTVIDDSETGDSIGSRVDLGTLGHHHVWTDEQSGTIDRETGTVTGIVTDPDGDPLESVGIEIIDSETNDIEATTTTNTDGEYSIELATERTYEIIVEEDGFEQFDEALFVEFGENTLDVSLEYDSLPPIVGDNPPRDLDGNGLYEDINGDGTADVTDVQALHQNLGSDPVQDNSEAFNFADDDPDEVTEADVEALYDRVTGGDSDE